MSNDQEKITSEGAALPRNAEVERRELVSKLGKFALYAAPFTVLAHTNRAEAASGTGPGTSPFSLG